MSRFYNAQLQNTSLRNKRVRLVFSGIEAKMSQSVLENLKLLHTSSVSYPEIMY